MNDDGTGATSVIISGINNAEYASNVQAASAIAGTAGCEKWAAAEVALFKAAYMVPFVNSAVPTFGKGVQFEFSGGSLWPQSVRMLG